MPTPKRIPRGIEGMAHAGPTVLVTLLLMVISVLD